jgi:hypothetical protein
MSHFFMKNSPSVEFGQCAEAFTKQYYQLHDDGLVEEKVCKSKHELCGLEK